MIRLEKIRLSYGRHVVLDNLTLAFEANRMNCILGPSGCGKTSILNLLAGLIQPERGHIEPFPLQVSYIFQDTRILPWKTVYDNVTFALQGKMNPDAIHEQARRYLTRVGLWDHKDQYPASLSGGMKQRVSIARAFAYPSSVILMDEAFQGLDFILKNKILEDFCQSWSEDPRTVVFVTHDLDEALQIGQEIFILGHAAAGQPHQISVQEAPLNRRANTDRLKEKIRMLMDQ